MIIGMDGGKFATKGVKKVGEDYEKFYCRTKVEELMDEGFENGFEKGYIVEHDGITYKIGEEARREDFDVSKKKLHHKLPILLGIAELVGSYDDVDLFLGCPITTFVNKEKKEEFKYFIKGEEDSVELIVSKGGANVSKRFRWQSINPLPESIGFIYKEPMYCRDRLIGIMDIGGLNVNGAIYEKLKPIPSTAFTINEGGLILRSKIKDALKVEYDMNVQDYEVPYYMKNGVFENGKRLEEADLLIHSVIREQLNIMMDEAKKHNWNTRGMEIVFSGGGSLDIKDAIKDIYPHYAVSETAIWDNPTAFHRVGELVGAKSRG